MKTARRPGRPKSRPAPPRGGKTALIPHSALARRPRPNTTPDATPPTSPDPRLSRRSRPAGRLAKAEAPTPARRAEAGWQATRRRRDSRLPDSRQRILTAATAEFALRGFEGTTVDRISARARLNKAMIYYHFHSKKDLYSTVLRSIFTTMGDGLSAIAASDAAPADKLDRFVAAFVTEGQAHAHVAPIMLREIAEGGHRLDEETYTVMVRVVRAMTGIITEGRAAGQFGPVDPILLYLTTVWPIVVYLATTPIRSALARVARFDVGRLDPERFIAHLQMLNRHAVMPAAPGAGPTGERS